jgi:hypothetical protein
MDEELNIVIYEDESKQVRMVVHEFRDSLYFGFRRYYQDFEGEWQPTKEGVTFPYTLAVTANIFAGFCEIMSQTEVLDEVVKHAKSVKETE